MGTYRLRKRRSTRRGHALLVSMILSGVALFATASYLKVVTREIPQQAKRIDRNRALEVSDAGIEHAFWYIHDRLEDDGRSWWLGECELFAAGLQEDDFELVTPEGLLGTGETYEVDIDYLADSQSGLPTFWVQSTGTVTRVLPRGGQMTTRKTMAVMTRPAGFSDFARFVATGNLTYGAGAVLDGRVHTNGDLRVSGATLDRPILFRRQATVAGRIIGRAPDEVFFYNGFKEGAKPVPLPDVTSDFAQLAQQNGLYFDLAVGSSLTIDLTTMNYPAGFNGILYCNQDIRVFGKPSRPITLVSGDDIRIMGDILPGDDDRHVVGLIAKDEIHIDQNTQSGLEINAALMAISRSWRALGSGSKYDLTIRGSIVTNTGGSAGPYLAGQRNYIYDRRLLFYQPPMYPDFPGGKYVMTSWMEAPGEKDWRDSGLGPVDSLGIN